MLYHLKLTIASIINNSILKLYAIQIKQIIGSIFPEKLIYQKNIEPPNQVNLRLLYATRAGSGAEGENRKKLILPVEGSR